MSMDGQGTKNRRNIAENFNCLSRAHERYRQTTDRQTDKQTDRRQTTDGRAIAYSEREREFTFAKNLMINAVKGCAEIQKSQQRYLLVSV